MISKEQEQKKVLENFIKRNCPNGILLGTDTNCRLMCSYRTPMKEMVNSYGQEAIDLIQKSYDGLKRELKPGERILNTNLEELGIKL